MDLSPTERTLRARCGGFARSAAYDGRQVTKAALRGTFAKDERAVLEAAAARGETLDPAEIARRATALRRSRMAALSLRAAQVRRKKKAAPAIELPGAAQEGRRDTADDPGAG
ncbi:MAG: hypothetical protein ABSB75_02005 [Candidatus Limnocylindrales bacterium]